MDTSRNGKEGDGSRERWPAHEVMEGEGFRADLLFLSARAASR